MSVSLCCSRELTDSAWSFSRREENSSGPEKLRKLSLPEKSLIQLFSVTEFIRKIKRYFTGKEKLKRVSRVMFLKFIRNGVIPALCINFLINFSICGPVCLIFYPSTSFLFTHNLPCFTWAVRYFAVSSDNRKALSMPGVNQRTPLRNLKHVDNTTPSEF